jgi:hypothetical protein
MKHLLLTTIAAVLLVGCGNVTAIPKSIVDNSIDLQVGVKMSDELSLPTSLSINVHNNNSGYDITKMECTVKFDTGLPSEVSLKKNISRRIYSVNFSKPILKGENQEQSIELFWKTRERDAAKIYSGSLYEEPPNQTKTMLNKRFGIDWHFYGIKK